MKQRLQGLVVGLLVAALFAGTMSVVAAATRTIEVTYGVNVVVDGVPQVFDYDMRPFQTGGRTFLPVRGIADALGLDVGWDGATSTVYLTTPPPPEPTAQAFMEIAPWFERSSIGAHGRGGLHVATVNMLGQPYANAISSGTDSLTQWAHHNLNGQFNTLSGIIGRVDGTGGHVATIIFIGDGRQLASFSVDGNTMPRDVTVDVRGVSVLRIQVDGAGGFGLGRPSIAFANAMIE